jgi:hypothetical protein
MEVSDPLIGLVGDAGGFQVGTDRLGGLMVQREHGFPGGHVLDPASQVGNQRLRDRLIGRAPVLRAAGAEEDGRVRTIEPETLRR